MGGGSGCGQQVAQMRFGSAHGYWVFVGSPSQICFCVWGPFLSTLNLAKFCKRPPPGNSLSPLVSGSLANSSLRAVSRQKDKSNEYKGLSRHTVCPKFSPVTGGGRTPSYALVAQTLSLGLWPDL